jgi:multiple sugar transport system permease protein
MVQWLDTPLLTLFDAVTIPRSWPIIALLSLTIAWVARRKRYSVPLWFTAALGGFIAVSEIVRQLVPDAVQEVERGQRPSASHVIWSDAAFRADFGLLLIIILLSIPFSIIVRRLLSHANGALASAPWQVRLSAAGGALILSVPLILWVWFAGWLIIVADYTGFVVPLAVFVGVAVLTAALWSALEGSQRRTVLLAIAAGVVLAQLRFNATRPPTSMFESDGSVPFFLALLPVLAGVLVASAIRRGRLRRRYGWLGWELGFLAWIMALLGWTIRFMGFYNYQNSYAFSLGSLFGLPVRAVAALSEVYYSAVPREIAEAHNVANMAQWETTLVVLAGIVLWLGLLAWLQWQLPVQHTRRTFWQRLQRVRHPQLSLRQRYYLLALALIAPAIALRTFTTFYPFVQTLILSVQRYNPAFPPRRYTDFGNFERLSTDLVVRESMEFTLAFVFVSTFFQMFLGLAIAHLLNANFPLRGLARTISLIPWAVPMVVAAIGFRWMFDDQFGMIPDLLRRIGIHEKWLIDPVNAQIAVIFVNIWKSTPFCALLLLAGLQGISQDLYEAAKVDGANWFDSLRFITVPMIMPIMVTTTMFMLVWQLAVFDLPFAMTGGAPGFATTVVAQKIYLEIISLNYGFAASISVMLVIIVTVIGGLGIYTLRRVEVSA